MPIRLGHGQRLDSISRIERDHGTISDQSKSSTAGIYQGWTIGFVGRGAEKLGCEANKMTGYLDCEAQEGCTGAKPPKGQWLRQPADSSNRPIVP